MAPGENEFDTLGLAAASVAVSGDGGSLNLSPQQLPGTSPPGGGGFSRGSSQWLLLATVSSSALQDHFWQL